MPLVCDGNDVLFATQVYKIHRFQNPYTKETYDYQIDLGWQLTEGDDFVICGSPYQVHADVDVGVGPSGDVPVLTRRELWTTSSPKDTIVSETPPDVLHYKFPNI